jgi:hypothetical protein
MDADIPGIKQDNRQFTADLLGLPGLNIFRIS